MFLCMGGNSTTWMNTAVLVTCLRNFRGNRGPVAGILKGYIALSTAIFTDVCTALFSDSAASFLLMLAVVPLAVCITAMLSLREVPASGEEDSTEEKNDRWEGRYFAFFNVGAVVVAVYLLAYDLSGSHGVVFSRVFAGVLLILMATPLGVPSHLWLKSFREKPREAPRNDVEAVDSNPLLTGETEGPGEGSAQMNGRAATEEDGRPEDAAGGDEEATAAAAATEVAEKEEEERRRAPAIGEDHTVVELARSGDFWVLFASFLCGVGTVMMVMNNMGQIGEAMGYDDVSVFVSMLSVCGFFGRLAAGSVSEYFIRYAAAAALSYSSFFVWAQSVAVGDTIVLDRCLPVIL